MTISRVENACKPLILQGLQKNIKIISTQYLTVLTKGAITESETGKQLDISPGSMNFRKKLHTESSVVSVFTSGGIPQIVGRL